MEVSRRDGTAALADVEAKEVEVGKAGGQSSAGLEGWYG